MTSAIIHRTVPMGKTSAVGNITPREARLNSDELPQLLLQLGDLFLQVRGGLQGGIGADLRDEFPRGGTPQRAAELPAGNGEGDRKSTRLNSSHVAISYAVFCLK